MMEILLTTKDLCKRWQCSTDYVYDAAKKGLEVIPLGAKDFRFSIDDVIDYENSLKEKNRAYLTLNSNIKTLLNKKKCNFKI